MRAGAVISITMRRRPFNNMRAPSIHDSRGRPQKQAGCTKTDTEHGSALSGTKFCIPDVTLSDLLAGQHRSDGAPEGSEETLGFLYAGQGFAGCRARCGQVAHLAAHPRRVLLIEV